MESNNNNNNNNNSINKRRKIDDDDDDDKVNFIELLKWIQSYEYSYIHPSIDIDDNRQLIVKTKPIIVGEIIFQIPILLSSSSSQSNNNYIPEYIHKLVLISASTSITDNDVQKKKKKNEEDEYYYHPISDLILAWYLASRPVEWISYINNLPKHIELPRMWSDTDILQPILTGSPVLHHIRKQREGIINDYNKLIIQHKKIMCDDNNNNNDTKLKTTTTTTNIPSMEDFSYAMAIVTSRAFTNQDGISTIVPLLDMCNHYRGCCGNFKDSDKQQQQQQHNKKNVSYEFIKKSDTSIIIVRAMTDICINDTIRITYGTQSNNQLLINYGFCIKYNIEPDYSSNDILQFNNNNNNNICLLLRTGPKSYTYGCFIKVLETFYPNNNTKNNNNNNNNNKQETTRVCHKTEHDDNRIIDNDVVDDMEAFLNDCDEHEYDGINEDDSDCDYYNTDLINGKNNIVEEFCDDNNNDDDEIEALCSFSDELTKKANAYVLQGDKLKHYFESSTNTNNNNNIYYMAILIHSELRIIYFFLHAIEKIKTKLKKAKYIVQATKPSTWNFIELCDNDEKLIQVQTDELAEAYMKIRHHSDF